MRALLLSLATVIGIYEGRLLFKFGTFSPCAVLSVQVGRVHEQAKSELSLRIAIQGYLSTGAQEQLQHAMRQALGIPDPHTPLHCVYALWKLSSDDHGSVELAKNLWRAAAEAQHTQR